MAEIKRKHHYVWAYYLKLWSTNDRDVWYTTKKNKVAQDSVYGVACERDFYKVNFLDEKDIEFIKGFSAPSAYDLQELHMGYLSDFYQMSKLYELTKIIPAPDEVKNAFKEFQHNALEDLYSAHETEAIEIIHALKDGDLQILDDMKHKISFIHFMGMQISRSKSFEKALYAPLEDRERYESLPNAPYTYAEYKRLTIKNRWFMSYMLGMNVGSSMLFSIENNKFELLKNDSTEDFITSDKPVINIHKSTLVKRHKYQPPTGCDFYYPISPKYAFIVHEAGEFDCNLREANLDEVQYLNDFMYRSRKDHAFATSKELLLEIKARKSSRKE